MENEDKLEKLLQQNLHGIKIVNIAEKLDVDRSTVYKYLNSFDLQGKAHYERGIAYPGPSIENKSSSEKKSSRFGFFEYLKHRSEREQRQRLLNQKMNLLQAAQSCESIVKSHSDHPNSHFYGELADYCRERMKELDKELEKEVA